METAMSTKKRSNVMGYFLNRETPHIVNAKGVYLYDDQGNRILDASGGVIVCSIGHGVEEIVEAAANQMKKAAFVFRRAFRTPELEMAATKVCETTNWDMDRIFFVSGGSEATETAVKLARKYHIENGNPSKFRVISRWQSYHGSTFGALSWTGFHLKPAPRIVPKPSKTKSSVWGPRRLRLILLSRFPGTLWRLPTHRMSISSAFGKSVIGMTWS